jgi:hypothetical protein
MASLSLAFNLSASATGMAQGINAGVVELQKLGYAAKQTARDVSTLKTIEISKLFISGVSSLASTFQNFTSGAAQAIDRTRQLSQSLGVSYGELRQLQVAADLSGASSDQLATAFTRAQVTISNASRGSKEAQAALGRLGLSVEGLATQTSTQQFASIASAINSIQSPAERAAAAVAIFGRSGAELLPTFRELPENLNTANQVLSGFRDGIDGIRPDSIDAIGDAFGLAGQALQELAGRVLTQLAPALVQGANEFVAFAQQVDVAAAAESARQALQTVASVASVLASVLQPLASNLLPAIGGYLAFINRQAIASGISQLAAAFAASAAAASSYAGAAGTAAAASAGLAVSIRGLLYSSGIGALVVALGLASGALIEWAIAGNQSSGDVQQAVAQSTAEMKRFTAATAAGIGPVVNLGEKVKEALKVPERITAREFAEGAIGNARSAITSLATELGGLNNVPQPLLNQFDELVRYAIQVQEAKPNSQDFIQAAQAAATLTESVRRLSEARKADEERIKQANEAARKANEDARKRVEELRSATLTDAEKSRLTLNQDLEAIAQNIARLEQEAAEARRQFDIQGLIAAEERLNKAKDEAGVLRDAAKEQDRQRRLQARGIDLNLLKPATGIADEIKNIKDAFGAGEIDQGQFAQGLRNLAAEGIKIRQEIAAELSKPSQRALQVSDVRTNEGISLLLGLRREDPALEQRRQQLQKLDEIKQAIRANGLEPVDILGA